MPTHAEKRRLPHSPEQMFALVADVEKYPEFLPWCVATRVRGQDGDTITADMVIGYKMFRERFTSKVHLDRPGLRIDVAYSEGPFKYLNNHWLFIADGEGTIVDFYVDFEFRSRLLQKLIGAVFNEAVKIMVHAFEKRAKNVYG
ncbi:MAG: type II toxin-antitoxin system RatA family toxin [Rhodospirillales bacterium]|jgi:coenzyme Q-binding protein COQ10|nr:ubiquinone-binding protein [Rhodospirillaceae bacterium]MDP6430094.1 type II toxin-antitoxin system RatA family toxin [Rhodospirillales bacterium]MDP6643092.1 type II toxin-antitoxin system RatA family toxin [Rhodospirillales bacterium]MDP6841995.1 type II toxin-antitoxin system RatA family toxin [Rhodospirillales bacterium]|tara:strand:- start:81 stop:512 length:432 start_codon:yes stop_codon:yes gene_type:complete